MGIRRRVVLDGLYCAIVALVFCITVLVDFANLPLPSWCMTVLDTEESVYSIMDFQLTLAVLPLAIIALVTGIMKDTLYGVSIMKYIMYMRPIILRFPLLSFAQIGLSIAAFLCMNYAWYNLLVFMFCLTIGNTAIMMWDCFRLITAPEQYKTEIRQYLMNHPTAEVQKVLIEEIERASSNGDKEATSDAINLMKDIALHVWECPETFSQYLSDYGKSLIAVFRSKKSDIFIAGVNSLINMYERCNKLGIELTLFDRVSYEFYNGMRYLKLTDVQETDCLYTLNINLQQNKGYDGDNQLKYYAANIYKYSIVENQNRDTSTLEKIRFAEAIDHYTTVWLDNTLTNILNRLLFLRAIISNCDDVFIISELYNKKRYLDKEQLLIKFCLLQYMYYLAECEPLVDEKTAAFAQKLISDTIKFKNELFYEFWTTDFDQNVIEFLYDLMSEWELVIPDSGFKACVSERVTTDFLVYSLLSTLPEYELGKAYNKVAREREFSVCHLLFDGFSAEQHTKNSYEIFCKDFGVEYDETRIDLLRQIALDSFKQFEINKAKEEYEKLHSSDHVKKSIEEHIDYFGGELSIQLLGGQYPSNSERINLIYRCEYCFELLREQNSRFYGILNDAVVAAVVEAIKHRIDIIQKDRTGHSVPLLQELKTRNSDIAPDMIIGGGRSFHISEWKTEEKVKQKYKKFLSRKSRYTLLVDSRKLYVEIKRISVSFVNLTREEIVSSFVPDKEGKCWHRITNEINGYFTEEEWVQYCMTRVVKVEINCEVVSSFAEGFVGYGIEAIN